MLPMAAAAPWAARVRLGERPPRAALLRFQATAECRGDAIRIIFEPPPLCRRFSRLRFLHSADVGMIYHSE